MRPVLASLAWICLLLSVAHAQESKLDWRICTSIKVKTGRPKESGPLGHWLSQISWRGIDTRPGRLMLVPTALDSEGNPATLDVSANVGGDKTPTIQIHSIEHEAYPLFSVLGTSINFTKLGEWSLWSAQISGTTNGDPPDYFLWVVEGPEHKGIGLGHGLGRGLMGFHEYSRQIELTLLSQGTDGPSFRLQRWLFTQERERVSARRLEDQYLFALDGGVSGILSEDPAKVLHDGMRFYSRSILSLTKQGGIAAPSKPEQPVSLPFQAVSGWTKMQDHYTSQNWGDLHWAWDLAWYQGPIRRMVMPSDTLIPFKWAKTIRVFQGKAPFGWPRPDRVGPLRAQKMVSMPGWGVVLVQDRRAGSVAVGLVAPELRTP